MKILQLTAHFRPNIGGVETHLNDLCRVLTKRDFKVLVLTYRPLQTNAPWKVFEKEKNLEVIRLPWIPNLFYKFIKLPFLEFIYLMPGLFLACPLVLFFNDIQVIHAHGLVAGSIAVFWSNIFNKKVIISVHSIYHFPKKGLYREFTKLILNSADIVMGLSNQSLAEIKSLVVSSKKIRRFTYWIDLNNFKKVEYAKKKLGWKKEFIVLFVGRLILEKGVRELLESARKWRKGILLKIIGTGPLSKDVRLVSNKQRTIEYIGSIDQNLLPLYYSSSDILVVPSVSEEGFGRVILESLACGTPVVAANSGAIPEAIDATVGRLIDVSEENIKEMVEYLYKNSEELKKLANNCRDFAERRYSEKNAETIIKAYQK